MPGLASRLPSQRSPRGREGTVGTKQAQRPGLAPATQPARSRRYKTSAASWACPRAARAVACTANEHGGRRWRLLQFLKRAPDLHPRALHHLPRRQYHLRGHRAATMGLAAFNWIRPSPGYPISAASRVLRACGSKITGLAVGYCVLAFVTFIVPRPVADRHRAQLRRYGGVRLHLRLGRMIECGRTPSFSLCYLPETDDRRRPRRRRTSAAAVSSEADERRRLAFSLGRTGYQVTAQMVRCRDTTGHNLRRPV